MSYVSEGRGETAAWGVCAVQHPAGTVPTWLSSLLEEDS